MSCGKERVNLWEFLPADVVAAEKETLQAGQAAHLWLEREGKTGRGKRERWRDVKSRAGRGHRIITVVKAWYPSPFSQSPCSSQLRHIASSSSMLRACTHRHTNCRLLFLHMERGGAAELVRGGGRGERAKCSALMQRSFAAASTQRMRTEHTQSQGS